MNSAEFVAAAEFQISIEEDIVRKAGSKQYGCYKPLKHQADNPLRIEKDAVVDTGGNTGKAPKSKSVRDHDTDIVGPIGRSERYCS